MLEYIGYVCEDDFPHTIGIENLAVYITNFFISIVIAKVLGYRIILVHRYYKVLKIIGVLLIL